MQQRIKEMIGEVLGNSSIVEKIDDTTDLVNDIGLDSLTIINFILRVEDEFGIEIDFDEFEIQNLRSLPIFCEYIGTKLQECVK